MNNFINNITNELNNINDINNTNNQNIRTSINNYLNEINQNNNNLNNLNDLNNFFNNINNNIQNRINTLNNPLNNPLNNQLNNPLNNPSNNLINNPFNNIINNQTIQYYPIINYNQFYQNVSNSLNQQYNQEDVIIALTDDEFKTIECIEFKDINHELNEQCNICLECFENDQLTPETDCENENKFLKLKCEHIFHYECIENWLKKHSNKCPVCRIEIAKGNPINL